MVDKSMAPKSGSPKISPVAAFDAEADALAGRTLQLIAKMIAEIDPDGAKPVERPSVTDPCVAVAMAAAASGLTKPDSGVVAAALAMTAGIGAELFDVHRQIEALALAAIASLLLGRRAVVLVPQPAFVALVQARIEPAQNAFGFTIDVPAQQAGTPAAEIDADIVLAEARSFANGHLAFAHRHVRRDAFRDARRRIFVQNIDLLFVEDQRPVLLHDVDRSEHLHDDVALAMAAAKELVAGRDFEETDEGRVFTAQGERALASATKDAAGLMHVSAYRDTVMLAALAALHDFQAGRDYQIADERVMMTGAGSGKGLMPEAIARIGLRPFLEIKHELPWLGGMRVVASARLPDILASQGRVAGVSASIRQAADELRRHHRVAVSRRADTMTPARLPPARLFRTRQDANAGVVRIVRRELDQGRAVFVVAGGDAIAEALAAAGIEHRQVPARMTEEDREALRAAMAVPFVAVLGKVDDFGEPLAFEGAHRVSVVFGESFAGAYLERQICDHLVARQSLGTVARFSSLEDPLFASGGALRRFWFAAVWLLGSRRALQRRVGSKFREADRRIRAQRLAGERRFENVLSFAPAFWSAPHGGKSS